MKTFIFLAELDLRIDELTDIYCKHGLFFQMIIPVSR